MTTLCVPFACSRHVSRMRSLKDARSERKAALLLLRPKAMRKLRRQKPQFRNRQPKHRPRPKKPPLNLLRKRHRRQANRLRKRRPRKPAKRRQADPFFNFFESVAVSLFANWPRFSLITSLFFQSGVIMAEITTSLIKTIREKTGAGMVDCKNALVEANGDEAAAIEILRKKGMATAGKKAGRVTAEGAVGSYIHMGGKVGVLV